MTTVIGRIGALALAFAFMAAPTANASTLYSIAQGDDLLRVIDPNDASTVSSVTISLTGSTILGGTGLAANPVDGLLYGLLRLDGQSGRELVTIDPVTGAATAIGNTGHSFAGLAFTSAGTLYGVTGESTTDSDPETLFTLSLADATPTLVLQLGNGDDGEAIAFDPADGKMYHASGHMDACTGSTGVCFESIDLGTLGISNIDISAGDLINEETQALTYWNAEGVFLWKQDHNIPGPLFRVAADGSETLIGNMDHQAKGLAFLNDIAAVPEPATLVLLGLGLAGLGGMRRRRAA